MLERPHIVQAVGQLDQQDPDVTRRRQQQLSKIFNLALIVRLKLKLR